MVEEVWRDIYFEENGVIYDYRGLYQVSNIDGKIKSLKFGKEKILKPVKTKNGYQNVSLWKDGNKKFFLVHRLVLHVFDQDGYFEGAEVNHIDENKMNNHYTNLEWTSHKDNMNHGTRNERAGKALSGSNNPRSKNIIGYSTTTTKVIIIQSTGQAKKFGFNQGHICECCNGKYFGSNVYKGYRWYYLDDIKNNKLEKED